MTEAPTQTVVDTPAPAQPGATVDNARADDLATILSSYEDETKPQPAPQPAPQPKAATPDPDTITRIAAWESRQESRDINDAVKTIRGEHDHVSDRLIKGWLNAAAEDNPKLKDVFANRFTDPARWEKALGALTREFDKEQSKLPDKGATEDVLAVTAAVRGASSTKAPPDQAPNYGAMTDAEFQKEKAKLGL